MYVFFSEKLFLEAANDFLGVFKRRIQASELVLLGVLEISRGR